MGRPSPRRGATDFLRDAPTARRSPDVVVVVGGIGGVLGAGVLGGLDAEDFADEDGVGGEVGGREHLPFEEGDMG